MQALVHPATSDSIGGTVDLTAGASAVSVPDKMVRARLGPYAGLYHALRAKHPPAAAHCLRVAIGCSKWAEFCNLPDSLRDVLETAGLLHDIGKIGVPDQVLQKPESLTDEEQIAMEVRLKVGLEILSSIGTTPLLVQTIQQARFSLDSETSQNPLSRMLKIVDAYDSMTSSQVFRTALSKESAVAELFKNAGTQFDPDLVRNFAELIGSPRPELEAKVAQRWLIQLASAPQQHFQGLTNIGASGLASSQTLELFHSRLLESLKDAAIFLDKQGKILHWNKAAEQLSGREAESVLHRQWSPKLMGLQCLQGKPLEQTGCPLQKSLATNTKYEADLIAVHTSGIKRNVVVSAIPLFGNAGSFEGFVVLIRDDSLQNDLEQKVRSLHAIATQDPLTKVANRAEMNRRLEEFVVEHSATGIAGSVIMCDIDFFKRINDNYSHQAGDEALITFANILRDCSRSHDLVARYGGEEFVILCDACDLSSATAQAEKIRRTVETTPVPALKGNTMTSSFGVTQLQLGDDPETFLARADRALMTAKETGRNRVVQLGVGRDGATVPANIDMQAKHKQLEAQRSSWLGWFTRQNQPIRSTEYLSAVPMEIAVEKLQGFIQDHRAEILSTTPSHLSIQIKSGGSARRRGEHPVPMIMNLDIQQVQYCTGGRKKVYQNRTRISVSIHPVRPRDRRQSALDGQAQQLLLSFQAYIVGQEVDDQVRQLIIEPR